MSSSTAEAKNEIQPTDTTSSAPTVDPTLLSTNASSSWKIPDGVEEHIGDGFFKVVAGAAIGGLCGVLLFRSGKGKRLASISAGVGVGLGSTYERVKPLFTAPPTEQ